MVTAKINRGTIKEEDFDAEEEGYGMTPPLKGGLKNGTQILNMYGS